MTNSIAIGLGVLILGAIVLDAIFTGSEGFLFAAQKFLELLEWLAFWR